jgi:hypothetical protein
MLDHSAAYAVVQLPDRNTRSCARPGHRCCCQPAHDEPAARTAAVSPKVRCMPSCKAMQRLTPGCFCGHVTSNNAPQSSTTNSLFRRNNGQGHVQAFATTLPAIVGRFVMLTYLRGYPQSSTYRPFDYRGKRGNPAAFLHSAPMLKSAAEALSLNEGTRKPNSHLGGHEPWKQVRGSRDL